METKTKSLRFELVTLDGTKLSEDVYEVRLPTVDGEIGVFVNHAPLVTVADTGIIAVRRKKDDPESKLEYFATNGGVIEILDNTVRVLVDEADREDEISEADALKAFEKAQKLRAEAKDQVSLSQAENLINRHAVQLKVAEIRRRKRRS